MIAPGFLVVLNIICLQNKIEQVLSITLAFLSKRRKARDCIEKLLLPVELYIKIFFNISKHNFSKRVFNSAIISVHFMLIRFWFGGL